MAPRLKILGFLNDFLQEPAMLRILKFEDEVFEDAKLSNQLVTANLTGQVALWCRKQSFWQEIVQNQLRQLSDQMARNARPILYYHLCLSLLGHQPNSVYMASLFAGSKPNARGILSSVDPDVMKLREHLAAAMIVFDLVGAYAYLSFCRLKSDDFASLPEIMEGYSRRSDLLKELLVFRRNAIV